jgi:hypothetical protein
MTDIIGDIERWAKRIRESAASMHSNDTVSVRSNQIWKFANEIIELCKLLNAKPEQHGFKRIKCDYCGLEFHQDEKVRWGSLEGSSTFTHHDCKKAEALQPVPQEHALTCARCGGIEGRSPAKIGGCACGLG